MTRRFWNAAGLTLPVFLVSMLPMLGVPVGRWLGPTIEPWLQLALATPVVLWAGWPFFERGFRSIVTGHLNMFTLIAIGTGAAYLYSLVAVLFPVVIPHQFRHDGGVPMYFEAAAVIITLVLLGQLLELRARQRTGAASLDIEARNDAGRLLFQLLHPNPAAAPTGVADGLLPRQKQVVRQPQRGHRAATQPLFRHKVQPQFAPGTGMQGSRIRTGDANGTGWSPHVFA
jgi:hypothetical protein